MAGSSIIIVGPKRLTSQIDLAVLAGLNVVVLDSLETQEDADLPPVMPIKRMPDFPVPYFPSRREEKDAERAQLMWEKRSKKR
jgi:hypothetical protein